MSGLIRHGANADRVGHIDWQAPSVREVRCRTLLWICRAPWHHDEMGHAKRVGASDKEEIVGADSLFRRRRSSRFTACRIDSLFYPVLSGSANGSFLQTQLS